MTVWEELQARGLIAQVTNEDEIKEMVNNGKATFYIGFDPIGQFSCRTFYGSLPYETSADGRKPSHRSSWRRNWYDWRSVWQN